MEPFLVREPQLAELTEFIRALGLCFASANDETKKALSEALFAECMQCAISVNGAELLAAGLMDTSVDPESKLARLRLGYCARKGCTSNRYRLKFYKHINLDWNVLLPLIDSKIQERADEIDQSSGVVEAGKRAELIRYMRRVVFGVGMLVLIFILRQYYLGGTIPFIRKAEKWHTQPNTNIVRQIFPY